MNKIAQYLNQHIAGNVYDKQAVRDAYATDRSILRITPRLVAIPETTQDIRKLLRFSNQLAIKGLRLPVTVRGGGHDKTGAAIGNGLIISTEKLSHIQEIDIKGRMVRVQAGITLGTLNAALELYGLTVPVAAHPDETIGGLIANCPTDPYANKYGGIYNYVDRAEIVLATGDVIQTSTLSRGALNRRKGHTGFEGELYRNLDRGIDENASYLSDNLASSLDASGYATIKLVKRGKTFDILPLLFASQGTLGVVSEVILRCAPLSPASRRLFVRFNNSKHLVAFLQFVKSLRPLAIDLYDSRIVQSAIDHGHKLTLSPQKSTAYAVLISFNDRKGKSKRRIKKCLRRLPAGATAIAETADNAADFNKLTAALSSYLNDDIRGERAPIADDTTIAPEHLADFLADLSKLEQVHDTPLPIFGSFATSNYHVRPELQLDQITGRQFALQFIRDYHMVVRDHHGSITGGAPEGSVKALVTSYSDREREIYQAVKDAFDPHNILNPAVKLGADAKTTIRHLRTFYNNYIVTD